MKSKSLACAGVALAFAGWSRAARGRRTQPGTVEVMTWWTEPGEKDALEQSARDVREPVSEARPCR